MKEEAFRIIKSTIQEIALYNRTPFVRSGLIICDEEHFKGWKLTENFLLPPKGISLSLYQNGILRGKTSFISSKDPNLAEALIRAAKGAAFQDPNFTPVTPDETETLSFSLTFLGVPKQISPEKAQKLLQNQNYAFYAESGYRTALDLPTKNEQTSAQRISALLSTIGATPADHYTLYLIPAESYTS